MTTMNTFKSLGAVAGAFVTFAIITAFIEHGNDIVRYAHDELFYRHPKRDKNAVFATCNSDAPQPYIHNYNRYEPVLTIEVDFKGCDITSAKIICEGAASNPKGSADVTKWENGYRLERPSPYCKPFTYKTATSWGVYKFD